MLNKSYYYLIHHFILSLNTLLQINTQSEKIIAIEYYYMIVLRLKNIIFKFQFNHLKVEYIHTVLVKTLTLPTDLFT